jgi:S1-C subfamily serine protease
MYFVARPIVTSSLGSNDSDSPNFGDGISLPYKEFAKRLVSGSDEKNFDFAILRLPEVLGRVSHRFAFADVNDMSVGSHIIFMGYPFDHLNLTCHEGIISSIYQSGPTRVLQLDASVNHSNSGGPLLDTESGRVLGIITRKTTGAIENVSRFTSIVRAKYQSFPSGAGFWWSSTIIRNRPHCRT